MTIKFDDYLAEQLVLRYDLYTYLMTRFEVYVRVLHRRAVHELDVLYHTLTEPPEEACRQHVPIPVLQIVQLHA